LASQSNVTITYRTISCRAKGKTQLGIFKFTALLLEWFFPIQYLKEVLNELIDNFNKSIEEA